MIYLTTRWLKQDSQYPNKVFYVKLTTRFKYHPTYSRKRVVFLHNVDIPYPD